MVHCAEWRVGLGAFVGVQIPDQGLVAEVVGNGEVAGIH